MSRMIKRGKCCIVIILIMSLIFLMAGCGDKPKEGDAGGGSDASQMDEPDGTWLYEPVVLPLEMGQTAYSAVKVNGVYLYYLGDDPDAGYGGRLCKYSIADGGTEDLPITFKGSVVTCLEIAEDGSIYDVIFCWGDDANENGQRLEKYDASGEKIFSVNVDQWIGGENDDNGYTVGLSVSGDKICLACERKIFLFDETGAYAGSIDAFDGKAGGMNNRICAVSRAKDGKIYACIADADMKCSLAEIDPVQKKVNTVTGMEKIPYINSNCMCPGMEKDLLVSDSTAVYEYDLAKKEGRKLFVWADAGLNGDQVVALGVVSDGKILAAQYDRSENKGNFRMLSRVAADERPQKEELVLATMMGGMTVLKNAVAEFNRTSDQYHITIKNYVDGDFASWEEQKEAQKEAVTKLNLELTAGNGPDIIDHFFFDSDILAKQGALEDLTPYLEKSAVIDRENFVGRTLEACTVDGKLYSLPKQFQVLTVVGRVSDVGEEAGWSVEDFMSAVEAHPGVQPLYFPGKTGLMWFCIPDFSDYVDTETGTCHFDSPEFVRVLEFANRYGDVAAPESDLSSQERFQRGEMLLLESTLDEFDKIQYYNEIFEGEACVVGYPTVDGSVDHRLYVESCAISANSAHKEGAWEFLESYVTSENTKHMYAFPAVKLRLEEQMQEAMDRKGDYVVTYSSGNGWSITYHPLTQEEADRIMEIINTANPRKDQSNEIGIIIGEEVNDFFEGTKPAKEVAEIIQRRVQLYLHETR